MKVRVDFFEPNDPNPFHATIMDTITEAKKFGKTLSAKFPGYRAEYTLICGKQNENQISLNGIQKRK